MEEKQIISELNNLFNFIKKLIEYHRLNYTSIIIDIFEKKVINSCALENNNIFIETVKTYLENNLQFSSNFNENKYDDFYLKIFIKFKEMLQELINYNIKSMINYDIESKEKTLFLNNASIINYYNLIILIQNLINNKKFSNIIYEDFFQINLNLIIHVFQINDNDIIINKEPYTELIKETLDKIHLIDKNFDNNFYNYKYTFTENWIEDFEIKMKNFFDNLFNNSVINNELKKVNNQKYKNEYLKFVNTFINLLSENERKEKINYLFKNPNFKNLSFYKIFVSYKEKIKKIFFTPNRILIYVFLTNPTNYFLDFIYNKIEEREDFLKIINNEINYETIFTKIINSIEFKKEFENICTSQIILRYYNDPIYYRKDNSSFYEKNIGKLKLKEMYENFIEKYIKTGKFYYKIIYKRLPKNIKAFIDFNNNLILNTYGLEIPFNSDQLNNIIKAFLKFTFTHEINHLCKRINNVEKTNFFNESKFLTPEKNKGVEDGRSLTKFVFSVEELEFFNENITNIINDDNFWKLNDYEKQKNKLEEIISKEKNNNDLKDLKNKNNVLITCLTIKKNEEKKYGSSFLVIN